MSDTNIWAPYKDNQPPSTAEEYVLYEPEIGVGAFAKVYRAQPKKLQESHPDFYVAVKMIDLQKHDADIGDLQKEVNVMRTVKHPNVVSVYTTFLDGEMLWIVMPYMEGGSCNHILKTLHPAGIKDEAILATLLKSALEGLVYLHNMKLIHRDIKAGNILVSASGEVQLADFGVAAQLDEMTQPKKANRITFIGTPCWMAPEVMMNNEKKGYNIPADVWSFGITAMELAFAAPPYSKYPPMKIILMTLQEKAPTLEHYEAAGKTPFSKDFREMLKHCLDKDPNKRWTAQKLLEKDKFFNKAVSKEELGKALVKPLPPIEFKVMTKKPVPKSDEVISGSQPSGWDFFSCTREQIEEALKKGGNNDEQSTTDIQIKTGHKVTITDHDPNKEQKEEGSSDTPSSMSTLPQQQQQQQQQQQHRMVGETGGHLGREPGAGPEGQRGDEDECVVM